MAIALQGNMRTYCQSKDACQILHLRATCQCTTLCCLRHGAGFCALRVDVYPPPLNTYTQKYLPQAYVLLKQDVEDAFLLAHSR